MAEEEIALIPHTLGGSLGFSAVNCGGVRTGSGRDTSVPFMLNGHRVCKA